MLVLASEISTLLEVTSSGVGSKNYKILVGNLSPPFVGALIVRPP